MELALELMEFTKLFKDGDSLILLTALIGGGIIASGIYFGTKIKDRKALEENNETINRLKDTITEQNLELQFKNEKLNRMTTEVLEFASTIDENTIAIKEIASKISLISNETLNVSTNINNEQKQRGELNFKVPIKDIYSFVIGGNLFSVSKSLLESGHFVSIPGLTLPIFLRLEKDKIYLSTKLLNSEGKLIVEIVENRWNINKNKVFSLNFDEKGLEIIDENGFVNFQIDINNSSFSIKMFFYRGNEVIFINDSGININKLNNENYDNFIKLATSVKPIFRHYGGNFIGKRL